MPNKIYYTKGVGATVLTINSLNQTIQNNHILKSVSIKIERGKVTTFLGPNGAGKTTLLKTIIGLLPSPTHNKEKNINTINIEKDLINDWSIGKRVAQGLVYLPQQTSLLQQLSVLDNLTLIYQYHPYWQAKKLENDSSWDDFKKEVTSWFSKTSLTCPFKQKAESLSGGQKRKLEVIRTILMKPKIAMVDEPFAGVDPKSIYELKEIFSNMAKKQNIAVVISDHNVDQLLSIADQIYVIIEGKVVASGGIKEILANNKTKDSYFGNQFFTEISKRFLN